MTKRFLLFLGALVLAVASPSFAQGPGASELVGQAMPEFSLPSQQGQLVEYKTSYYGKHNLILTFFPAAFTPV